MADIILVLKILDVH